MNFKLDKFEGPLDLLLELIERQKLDVCDVALASVTDQYLEIINQGDLDPYDLADFLLVASRLLLIKSKILLPSTSLSEEEESEVRDLERALEEYRRYKNQAKIVKSMMLKKNLIITRELWQGRSIVFLPPPKLSLPLLVKALENLGLGLEKFLHPRVSGYLQKVASIEERIKEILKNIETQATLTFAQLSASGKKIDTIINFLAVLFLFRERMIMVSQTRDFGEIEIKRNKADN